MTQINPQTEERIFQYIKDNLEELLKPKYGPKPNPGVAQYDLVSKFPRLTANEIRDYLADLEYKGKLQMVEERVEGLKFYIPIKKK